MPRSADGIYTSPWGAPQPWKPMNLWEAMVRANPISHEDKATTTRPMLNDVKAGHIYSYPEVEDLTTRAAVAFMQKGIKRGDTILLAAPTSALFLITILAVVRAGAVPALANPAYTAEELRHAATLVRAKVAISDSTIAPRLLDAGLKREQLWDQGDAKKRTGIWEWANKVDAKEAHRICDKEGSGASDPEDTFGIFFSSGTTGLPKAVCTSHRALLAETIAFISVPGTLSDVPEPTLVCLPCFHVSGFLTYMFAAIRGDTTVMVITSPFDMKAVIGALRQYKVGAMVWVPPILLGLVRSGMASPQLVPDLRRLTVGAAPLGASLHAEALKLLGNTAITQVWGATETTGAVTYGSPLEKAVPGSAGKVMPGVEVKIVDESGEAVDEGKPGEILVRGALLMTKYLHNEKATAEAIDSEGWYHTGDVAIIQPSEDIFIVDRIKELIKYKGMQVAPAELEDLILTHPNVADAGVIGVWDENESTELPRAYIVAKPGSSLSEAELGKSVIDFVAGRLAGHKKLRGGVKVVDAIPKNPSGKILRRFLREQAKEERLKEGSAKAKL